MKKLALLAAFLMIFGLALGVAQTEKPLTLSGSVEFSLGDDDVKKAPGSAFSAANTGAVATLKFGSESDKVEAGLTLNLVPAITKTDGADAMPTVPPEGKNNYYEFVQEAMDWYYYKMQGKTYKDDLGVTQTFPVIDFTTADDLILDGTITGTGPYTAADVDDLTKTATLTGELALIAQAVGAAVFGAIEGMSTIYSDNADYDGDETSDWDYISEVMTANEKVAAQAEADMYEDAYAYVFGDDTDDSWAASFPITNAYLKVKGIAGVVDVMFELMGRAVGVGSMVTSDKGGTSGNDANYGFSVALSKDVIPGVSASVLVTGWDEDMAAAVDEDYEDLEVNAEGATEPIWGGQLDIGYATDMFGAKVQVGIVDFKADPLVWIASVQPFVSMPDLFGLSVKGEFNVIGSDPMGLAAAASVGGAYMGIAPTVTFYWKDENFGGDDTIDDASGADDITGDAGLMAEFNSTDLDTATALAVALSFDLAELMGMKLITVSGGYDMLLSGSKNSGWKAGVGLDFAEVLAMPVTFGFNVAKWEEEDLTWAAVLGYTYDALAVSFTVEQTEEDVIGWTLAGKVSF